MGLHWRNGRWIDEAERSVSKQDFEYGKQRGYLFDSVVVQHDELVKTLFTVCKEISLQQVVEAFLASLTSRQLSLRSVLGSFIIGRSIPNHDFSVPKEFCPCCGHFEDTSKKTDLNVLSFERFKWGGLRHSQLVYQVFDLQQFLLHPSAAPSAADCEVLKQILSILRSSVPESNAAVLAKRLSGLFPSNQAEREVVLCILGYCGILETSRHPGFLRDYVPASRRSVPNEMAPGILCSYPIAWWRGFDGVNEDAVKELFHAYL